MLVDDHELIRQGLRGHLERRPEMTVVAEAGTVRQALIRAAKERPGIVMMDIQLPDGNGIEACRAIKADMPETKVIMLTGFADLKNAIESKKYGAEDFVSKPYDLVDLLTTIERVLSE